MPNPTDERRRIQSHITNLSSQDQKVSSRAEGCLIRFYGSRALEPLIDACLHPLPSVRFRAVWALGYTQEARAYETILRLTDDPDERVRYDATIALGILGDDRAIEPLIEIFLSDDETRPAGMAFRKMGPKSIAALIEVWRRGNPNVRWSVVQVVGNFAVDFGDARSLDLLEAFVGDPDAAVRENAEFWLQECRG